MPLLAFWKSAPEDVAQLTIEQIVASAGDGILKDNSTGSQELRQYLAQIPSTKIVNYVEQCLAGGFSKSGMVLQDLVNELGRRLEYAVENGRYQGTTNAIGFDGLWLSPDTHSIIIEVKTTDAYRISLDTIAAYRNKLLAAGKIHGPSSVLIAVGREDTGELEAQVRGSRHAWDMRLISADALSKLVQLKENTEGNETGLKIRSLLAPMEYTRIDKMIDVMFTAAADVEATVTISSSASQEAALSNPAAIKEKGVWQFTDQRVLDQKREQIISALGHQLDTVFIRKSGAYFWNAKHDQRLICSLSKHHEKGNLYWFGYRTEWRDFLIEDGDGLLVLGCVDLPFAFCVRASVIAPLLPNLNTTMKDDQVAYWHLLIVEPSPGRFALAVPGSTQPFSLDPYRMPLT